MNKYTQKISENMQNQLREYVKTQTKRQTTTTTRNNKKNNTKKNHGFSDTGLLLL